MNAFCEQMHMNTKTAQISTDFVYFIALPCSLSFLVLGALLFGHPWATRGHTGPQGLPSTKVYHFLGDPLHLVEGKWSVL